MSGYFTAAERLRTNAYEAHRKGRLVMEKTPTGNRQLVNPFRRDRRALEQRHAVTTGRQWVRLRRRLQQAHRRGRGSA